MKRAIKLPNVTSYIFGGILIGLAALGAERLIQFGEYTYADQLSTIIISSGVLYEIFGPASAKLGLYLAKAYDPSEWKDKEIDIRDDDYKPPIETV